MLAKPKIAVIALSALVVAYGLVGGVIEKVAAEEDDAYRQLDIFSQVLRKVKEDYVEQPDLDAAFQGALQGMVEALDPFSSFVPAAAYRELKDNVQLTGSPGLILSKRFGYLYVVAVRAGSPAEREGLRTGDLVESIENHDTMKMSSWEAMARLQGAPETEVSLRVVRARRTEPSLLTLQREIPQPQMVTSRVLEDGVGLLRVPAFEADAAGEIEAKLKLLAATPVRGLLIDLRGSADGNLDEAVRAADLFLPRGLQILTVSSRGGSPTHYVSLQDPIWNDTAVVVLTDGGTSGAAEVFAAALQDHRRAEIVGERSNGKGSEQTRFEVGEGAMLFVSTALFTRPNGKPLQGATLRESGVTPDVRAPDQEFITNFYFENTSEDSDDNAIDVFYRDLDDAVEGEQLRQALDRVHQLISKKAA